jgi:hypothetical protein
MEQKPSGEINLSWREAIIEVLKKSSKPMSSVEIVAAIRDRKLRNVTGNTPEATVGAQIYSSIKKDGECSPFVQISPNVFSFKQQTKVACDVPQTVEDPNPANGLKSNSKITEHEMPLTYADPLTAVFLRILAWEKCVAMQELPVKDLVNEHVQTARMDLGLKKNTMGAPHAFLRLLRNQKPPLLTTKPTLPNEDEWKNEKYAWRLWYLPSHRLVRSCSKNPIPKKPAPLDLDQPVLAANSGVVQCVIGFRNPALPHLRITIGKDKPDPKLVGEQPGVYFLREDNSLYIGQSDEFTVRWRGHSKSRKIKSENIYWWIFISTEEMKESLTYNTIDAAEALLISFWNEVCRVTNSKRGGDKKPAFVYLQQAILLATAASSALLWLMRDTKQINEFWKFDPAQLFSHWKLPFKPLRARQGCHWPECYLMPENSEEHL